MFAVCLVAVAVCLVCVVRCAWLVVRCACWMVRCAWLVLRCAWWVVRCAFFVFAVCPRRVLCCVLGGSVRCAYVVCRPRVHADRGTRLHTYVYVRMLTWSVRAELASTKWTMRSRSFMAVRQRMHNHEFTYVRTYVRTYSYFVSVAIWLEAVFCWATYVRTYQSGAPRSLAIS